MTTDRFHRQRVFGVAVLIWLGMSLVTAGGTYYLVARSQQLVADAINASACGLRGLAQPGLVRAKAAVADPKSTPAVKKRNAASVRQIEAFIATQRTVPRDFDCAQLKP